jgi:ferrous iron transport protein B
MDRFMRWIGLPGKSFVPMLVGFGCSVPAIMATRTLESKRDRFLTIFMTPFMSCSAKLPVWVLFGVAFCPERPGLLVTALYLCGIALGIATGLALKHSLFRGSPTHFIMELPPYHLPRPRHIFLHTWERLRIFIWRAGAFIVPMVLVLGTLNTLGTDGSVGNEDSGKSVLSVVGRSITPVFEPIGVEKDNWQASVSILTGLFAKESVIGTLNGLYGQGDAASRDAADASAPVDGLRRHFPKGFNQAFSFLLFVLLYVPCIAATGTVFQEIGKGCGVVFVAYLTVLGWSVATMYHAVTVSGSVAWFGLAAGLLAAMFGFFRLYGKKHRVEMI